MSKKPKLQSKSVAIQSADVNDPSNEFRPPVVCRKTGFKNLFEKSLTVAPEDSDEVYESLYVSRGRFSKGVQAGSRNCSQDISPSKQVSHEKSEKSRVVDRNVSNAKPGTSKASSRVTSDDGYLKSREESLAVIYKYGEKPLENSRSSNINHIYGPQAGSRRFSNETVLLIEDYQSYDYQNATHRQDPHSSAASSRRNSINCCRKRKHSLPSPVIRPVPAEFEEISERSETLVCRICHEGEDVELLLRPCLCKGSVGFVHGSCLKVWLEQSRTSRCELCNYPYAIKQTKKYSKFVSIKVFFKTVVSRRSLAYDVIAFVIITPLTLVGVVMCIQASIPSVSDDDYNSETDTSFQMEHITKAGMVMLSVTIIIAYGVWLYTMTAFHYKAWKAWYDNSYDVEVLPVRMTSEDQLEAMRRLSVQISRRHASRDQGSTVVSVLPPQNGNNYEYYQTRVTVTPVSSSTPITQERSFQYTMQPSTRAKQFLKGTNVELPALSPTFFIASLSSYLKS